MKPQSLELDNQITSSTKVEDIKLYRPDLTDEEAMVVLIENERIMMERYGEKGFDWDDLQDFADMQFPEREVFCVMAPSEGSQRVIASGKLSLLSGRFELLSGEKGAHDNHHVFVVLSGDALPNKSLDMTLMQPIATFNGVIINSSPFDGLQASMLEIYQLMPVLLNARAEQIETLKYVTSMTQLKSMLMDRERMFSIIGDDESYFVSNKDGVLTVKSGVARTVLLITDNESDFLKSSIGYAIERGALKCWDNMDWMLESSNINNNLQKIKPIP